MYKTRFSSNSYQDTLRITRYAEETLYIASDRFFKSYLAAVDLLELFPYSFPLFRSWKGDEFRKSTFLNRYTILYQVDELNKEILIYRVFHTLENWHSKI